MSIQFVTDKKKLLRVYVFEIPEHVHTTSKIMISFCQLPSLFTEAYKWLGKARKKYPPGADIWDFRRRWQYQADTIISRFADGCYVLGVQKKITLTCGDTIAMWSSVDSLVIKVLTGILQQQLQPFLSKRCYHLKGHGGLKGAVRDVIKHCPEYKFVCKTDVKSYYASIDHFVLMTRIHDYIKDRRLTGYVMQFLNRTVEWGGLYQEIKRGIPRGSSLSPLIGAFYLNDLDRKMETLDVQYFRYMDDIVILSSTRWKLRKTVKMMNRVFNELKLEQHPDKTFIGRTMRGFDFLGYHFKPGMACVAEKTVHYFKKHIDWLYEQGASVARIGQYVKKWVQWVNAGGLIAYLSKFKTNSEKRGGGSPSPHVSTRLSVTLILC